MARDPRNDDPVFRIRVPRELAGVLAKQARENETTIAGQILAILEQALRMQNMADQMARMERQVAELKKRRDGDE